MNKFYIFKWLLLINFVFFSTNSNGMEPEKSNLCEETKCYSFPILDGYFTIKKYEKKDGKKYWKNFLNKLSSEDLIKNGIISNKCENCERTAYLRELYKNKAALHNILYEKESVVRLYDNKKCTIKINNFEDIFYLCLLILDDKDQFNYSYSREWLNELFTDNKKIFVNISENPYDNIFNKLTNRPLQDVSDKDKYVEVVKLLNDFTYHLIKIVLLWNFNGLPESSYLKINKNIAEEIEKLTKRLREISEEIKTKFFKGFDFNEYIDHLDLLGFYKDFIIYILSNDFDFNIKEVVLRFGLNLETVTLDHNSVWEIIGKVIDKHELTALEDLNKESNMNFYYLCLLCVLKKEHFFYKKNYKDTPFDKFFRLFKIVTSETKILSNKSLLENEKYKFILKNIVINDFYINSLNNSLRNNNKNIYNVEPGYLYELNLEKKMEALLYHKGFLKKFNIEIPDELRKCCYGFPMLLEPFNRTVFIICSKSSDNFQTVNLPNFLFQSNNNNLELTKSKSDDNYSYLIGKNNENEQYSLTTYGINLKNILNSYFTKSYKKLVPFVIPFSCILSGIKSFNNIERLTGKHIISIERRVTENSKNNLTDEVINMRTFKKELVEKIQKLNDYKNRFNTGLYKIKTNKAINIIKDNIVEKIYFDESIYEDLCVYFEDDLFYFCFLDNPLKTINLVLNKDNRLIKGNTVFLKKENIFDKWRKYNNTFNIHINKLLDGINEQDLLGNIMDDFLHRVKCDENLILTSNKCKCIINIEKDIIKCNYLTAFIYEGMALLGIQEGDNDFLLLKFKYNGKQYDNNEPIYNFKQYGYPEIFVIYKDNTFITDEFNNLEYYKYVYIDEENVKFNEGNRNNNFNINDGYFIIMDTCLFKRNEFPNLGECVGKVKYKHNIRELFAERLDSLMNKNLREFKKMRNERLKTYY